VSIPIRDCSGVKHILKTAYNERKECSRIGIIEFFCNFCQHCIVTDLFVVFMKFTGVIVIVFQNKNINMFDMKDN
jgi:hypothetical protein